MKYKLKLETMLTCKEVEMVVEKVKTKGVCKLRRVGVPADLVQLSRPFYAEPECKIGNQFYLINSITVIK